MHTKSLIASISIFAVIICCIMVDAKAEQSASENEPRDTAKEARGMRETDNSQVANNINGTQIILPEGFIFSNKRVRFVCSPEDNRWFISFVALRNENVSSNSERADEYADIPFGNVKEPFSRPIEILPNKRLEEVVRVVSDKSDIEMIFVCSAEITTYHDRNFILLSHAGAESLFGGNSENEQPIPTVESILNKLNDGALPRKIDGEVDPSEDKSRLPKRLREALLALPRTTPLVRSHSEEDTQKDTGGVGDNRWLSVGAGQGELKDGYMIVDRVGRMIYDRGDQKLIFVFEADGSNLAEPPIAIHPSQLLEVVERKIALSSRVLRFRVSGQVTRYRGRNFLLLRKMLTVKDLGNLSK